MAMIDDIMAQLQSMGINVSGGFTGLPDISGFNISQALQGQYGLTEQQLPPSMFQGISSDLIKGGLAGTYSPQVQATGQTLMDKMLTQAQGKVGKQAFGGFAGSGQQQQYAGGIKDVYGKGMTDILAKTGQQRAQSIKSVQDMINQWQSQASKIRYG
tara:strand:- start:7878 stop:8348 length:471 start_codon:yes stop_codon:yes gene_type:complete